MDGSSCCRPGPRWVSPKALPSPAPDRGPGSASVPMRGVRRGGRADGPGCRWCPRDLRDGGLHSRRRRPGSGCHGIGGFDDESPVEIVVVAVVAVPATLLVRWKRWLYVGALQGGTRHGPLSRVPLA